MILVNLNLNLNGLKLAERPYDVLEYFWSINIDVGINTH